MPDRNEMSHFAQNPEVHIERSRMDLDQNIKFTGNASDLIPFYACEVLPGDSFDVSTTVVARLQTPIHPLMDTMFLDTFYFYIPYRLIHDHWAQFLGEPDQAWLPTQEYTIPRCNLFGYLANDYSNSTQKSRVDDYWSNFKNSFWDYIGVGFVVEDKSLDTDYRFKNDAVSALPLRCYLKCWEDWFRDENLQDPLNIYTGDNDINCYFTTYNADNAPVSDDVLVGSKLCKVNKLHDYFTSALPGPQRNSTAVGLTTGSDIPVKTTSNTYTASTVPLHLAPSRSGYSGGDLHISAVSNTSSNTVYAFTRDTPGSYAPDNLWAVSGSSIGISINDLRLAFQLQKFYEKSARYGARLTELIYGMFGVRSPDARLQRSEYLGGHRIPINITQVVNQAEQNSIPLGNTGAVSLTVDVDHPDFNHSFTEHGLVLGMCCIRYKHSYNQGTPRWLNRKNKFDFYWPVFANIGEQPIRQSELFNSSHTYANTFGFQEAWAEYRFSPDRVCAEMRPGVVDTLSSWNLADYYDTKPTLSSSWIQEDIAPIDRSISVTSSTSNQFLFDVLVKNKATRPMPIYSIPGLADHF